MTIHIRRMTPADMEAVVALAASLSTAPHWPREAYLAAINPNTQPARIALVAESEQEVAGFALVSLIPPQAELESIAVAPAWQRQGVAHQLFQSLSAELIVAGAAELILEVRASNAAALALYRAIGFEQTGLRPAYYDHPTEDALLLRKSLS